MGKSVFDWGLLETHVWLWWQRLAKACHHKEHNSRNFLFPWFAYLVTCLRLVLKDVKWRICPKRFGHCFFACLFSWWHCFTTVMQSAREGEGKFSGSALDQLRHPDGRLKNSQSHIVHQGLQWGSRSLWKWGRYDVSQHYRCSGWTTWNPPVFVIIPIEFRLDYVNSVRSTWRSIEYQLK